MVKNLVFAGLVVVLGNPRIALGQLNNIQVTTATDPQSECALAT